MVPQGVERLDLAGPVLVLGASGFIGANLLRRLLAVRTDVTGTVTRAVGAGVMLTVTFTVPASSCTVCPAEVN